jgi:hypothetical protein
VLLLFPENNTFSLLPADIFTIALKSTRQQRLSLANLMGAFTVLIKVAYDSSKKMGK